jgi:hypothetical protein
VGTFVWCVGTCAVEICNLSFFFIVVYLLFPLFHLLADCLKLSKRQWVKVKVKVSRYRPGKAQRVLVS